MRRLLALALLLLAPPAAAAEFVPDWRQGPATVAFQGRAVDVPADAFYATDGEAWFYGVQGADPRDPEARAQCSLPEGNGTWVLVDPRACSAGLHPAVSCSGAEAFCGQVAGVQGPCGPACDPPGHRTQERTTFTGNPFVEFLPDWRSGPATVTFRNASLAVPAGARYATDGEAWLYVVNASGGMEPPLGGCGDPAGNLTSGTWVLVPPGDCAWAPHPSVACWDHPPCVALGGLNREPYRPPPTTTTWFTTPTSFTPDCRAIQGLRCTPGPALGGVLLALAGAALTWRGRGPGRA